MGRKKSWKEKIMGKTKSWNKSWQKKREKITGENGKKRTMKNHKENGKYI